MNSNARNEAYKKLEELNLLAPVYKKAVSQKSMFVACHEYDFDVFNLRGGAIHIILRGTNGITKENGSPVLDSWEKMVEHLDKMIQRERNYIHENSHYACCEGWVRIQFDFVNPCYMNDFEKRLDENPSIKERLEKVNGTWQTKAQFLDMSEEAKEMESLLNRSVATEYATTCTVLADNTCETEKRVGFFEMECVSLEEIEEFEQKRKAAGCKFVSTMRMMSENTAEVYSMYGEIDDEELFEFVSGESAHGNENLKAEYEKATK